MSAPSDWLAASFAQQRPRAMAALTRYFGSVEVAEEAFAEACLKALTHWPARGKPHDPLAWLLTTARRSGLDVLRKQQRRSRILAENQTVMEETAAPLPDPDALRDDVLRLLFICCHPALERRDQIALALRVVAGLSVAEIARGFLVKAKTMEQRITRAKKRIADNPVPFETPSPQERGRRLAEVSVMVYLMFNDGWSASETETQMRPRLCEEAIRIARLLAELFPGMGEQMALLALLLFQHARRHARVDDKGQPIAFEDQARSLWSRAEMNEAQAFFDKARRIGHQGPYLIQAAIAAEHARAPSSDATDWPLIEAHYAALHALQPSPVVRLNLIAVQARTKGPAHALAEMQTLAPELDGYRWFHTMRAAFLEDTGHPETALAAYRRARALGPTAPERRLLDEKIAALKKNL
ncbi:RNA polymerase sigma factor [Roseobacter sinensis]|uniref:Sigma-70 family RNA polymerase sigma factor n=1 Tax=Roseobacter sinensis TaxID=2931391 RepID=A0ABT3BBD4_9RHOB|nr:sigma-70 family RNA polymerase sigma factor [Roseobacter sp. WL0113]MCV3270729.1 sigma-70 family RNA polymerase sigma factor [Roseobacter sp. WL0113]